MRARGLVIGIGVMMVAAACLATPIVTHDVWAGEFSTWQNEDALTHAPPAYGDALAVDDVGVPYGETLLIDNTAAGGQAIPPTDLIFTSDASMTGDWGALGGSEVRSIRFDFYGGTTPLGEHGPPAQLALFFYDGGTGYLWQYFLSPTIGWNHFDVNMYPGPTGTDPLGAGGWVEQLGNNIPAAWNGAFGSVDEVGIELQWNAGFPIADYDNQIYRIDNFSLDNEYLVPEPQTYVLLACVFISLAVTFRKRLNELIPQIAAIQ